MRPNTSISTAPGRITIGGSTIRDTKPQPPSYGGLNKDTRPPEPFLLNWSEGPKDTLILETGIDLFYPAALQPAQWPRTRVRCTARR